MSLQTSEIILRIGQNLWIDDEFERNYLESKKNGILVGGYWFYDDRISPREQAEILISALQGKKFELEVYIDWENTYGGEFKGLRNVVAMMELVEYANRIGLIHVKGIGIYTGYYWFRANSNPVTNASQYAYLRTKPLWLAWYTENPLQVLIPAPWLELTLWQWGTPAWAWGQKTREIDMNWYNGSRQEFDFIYGTSSGEEPPMTDVVKLSPNTNANRTIRRTTNYPTEPHIKGAFVASLLAGTEIVANATDFYVYQSNVRHTVGSVVYEAFAGDKWWKVKVTVSGVEHEGWVAEIHKGQTLLIVKQPTTPPPAPTLPTILIDVKDAEGKYIPVTVELKPKP